MKRNVFYTIEPHCEHPTAVISYYIVFKIVAFVKITFVSSAGWISHTRRNQKGFREERA